MAKPLAISAMAILALDVARRIFRLTQLFCPTRQPLNSWNPEDYGIPGGQVEEVWIDTPDGERLYGWYCRAKHPIASALYCHGNTGNLTNAAFVMPFLMESGINVLIFDYRGFGRSSGFATLNGVIADTLAAARLHDQIRPRHVPSILYGYSLGGAIAAQAIHRHPFDGFILQSTFTSLPAIARVRWPRMPVHWFSGHPYDTLRAVSNLDVPLLIIHGNEDEVCPSWMAKALYDACCSSARQILLVEGGLHKDLWNRSPGELVSVIRTFAERLTRLPRVVDSRPSLAERIFDGALRYVGGHVIRSAALDDASRR